MKTIFRILVVITFLYAGTTFSHERGDVDGMSVVFGGEPEPMLNGERQFLRWRFEDSKTKEPVADLEELYVTVKFDGIETDPIKVWGSGRDPGLYQTNRIFTKPGDGRATLKYKKKGNDRVFTVGFSFTVNDRKGHEIP
jgi:hypothetical protein